MAAGYLSVQPGLWLDKQPVYPRKQLCFGFYHGLFTEFQLFIKGPSNSAISLGSP
jgi:hypothetical protein